VSDWIQTGETSLGSVSWCRQTTALSDCL